MFNIQHNDESLINTFLIVDCDRDQWGYCVLRNAIKN